MAAIQLSQPNVAEGEARIIAEALQEQAAEHDFDPLTGVSIIFHESSFDSSAVSENGEDYGLAQIRARYLDACRSDRSPVTNPSAACRRFKKRLLDPSFNVKMMAQLITQNRQYCRQKTGSAVFHRWLASYQGRNNPRKKRYCVPGKGTWRVIEYRQTLIRQLRRRGFRL